jgi:BirA family biotin operon repressor/biotin-[acetyl-CoA-carboxylase] ligase
MGIIQQVRQFRQYHVAGLDSAHFSEQLVKKILGYGAPAGAEIFHFPKLDRCMNQLQELMTAAEARNKVLAAGTVVLADTLSASNGRFDRHWYAPDGGVWMAMAWPDTLLPNFSRLLPFAVGLACCQTIRSYQLDCRLKWVNDLLIRGRKIAGILCTTVQRPAGDRYHLFGMGINCNNRCFPEELQDNASSIVLELGRKIKRAELIGRLLAELQWSLGLLLYDEEQFLLQEERQPLLLPAWQSLCNSVGKQVEYGFDVQKKPLYQAVVTGFSEDGGLIMELADKSTITEYSGEIRYL